jgi:excisionase family DNA binding protein
MSEYLTTGQAAELLGVSKPTVVRAIQRGLLRPALVTPGQHRRFRKEDLLAFRARALAYPESDFDLEEDAHEGGEVELKGSAAVDRAPEAFEAR